MSNFKTSYKILTAIINRFQKIIILYNFNINFLNYIFKILETLECLLRSIDLKRSEL